MLYLDYSANTPVDEAVLQRFCEAERRYPGNANAHHQAGAAAKAAIDEATCSIARCLGAPPAGIIYTSGASEANNLAVKGLAALGRAAGRHILSTPLEHSSVSGSLEALQQQGYEVELLDIRPDGTVDLADLKRRLRPDTVLVAVTVVDSELGVVQPIAEIAALLRAYPNCRFHVDATQAVGKIPLQFEGMDTMSLTAHKFYGLNGIGVLVKRPGLALPPLIHGGKSTTPYRSGTPTVALACALALALEKATAELPARAAAVRSLNDRLRAALSLYPKVRINSPANAVPHILKGNCISAGAGYPGRVRFGQVRLCVQRAALPGSNGRQSGPAQCSFLLAHQSEPPYHRGGSDRLSAGLCRLLQHTDPVKEPQNRTACSTHKQTKRPSRSPEREGLYKLLVSLRTYVQGQNHSTILPTTPEPTVRPPSRIAKRRPSSIATGVSSSTCIMTLSPGMHISVPSGRVMMPVTSVVRK